MSVFISGIGVWLPDRVRTNDEWPESFTGHHMDADRIFNDIPPSDDPVAADILARDLQLEAKDPFLGAVRRRVADETTTSAQAEVFAAKSALADAGIAGSDVDLVLSYTMVPDDVSPPTACTVAHSVGARNALALGVEAACATAITQIEIARAYLESGLARVVLLTQSHLLLRVLPLLHPACPGLGDCATALVLSREGALRLRATCATTHGEHAPSVVWVRGRNPSEDNPWWQAGCAFRVGSRAPAGAKLLMRDTVSFGAMTVREASRRAGLDVSEISVLASVQPRGFIPGAIAQHLGIGRERAVVTYEDIAHVGGCGPVYNLHEARRQQRLSPGRVVALYGQGAGFTRAAAILDVA